MTRPDHEGFAEWDAAYVLGALTPADRRAYEEHMQQCPLCRDAVNALASMPGLLAQIRPESEADLPDQHREPVDLMDAMLRKEDRRRVRRRHRLLVWATAAAAVLVLVLAIPAALVHQPADDVVSVGLEPVDSAYSPMDVDVTLAPEAWGTRLSIECEYPAQLDYQRQQTWYALVVTDVDGTSTRASTWQAVPGDTVVLGAATAVSLDGVASLAVVTAGGEEVLTATIPGQ
ncbi:zf-HC2 domain-containing protein [Prauserella halophila]|uniref:Zf-HC2 domain-containing protein n=1 Tax=Prauserella halophila TaxID=185641 RepID=A0ABN1W782_9PSEU|nr:zf-HC2 domain-containing protein [Prauserella halophila]MCP2235817.1 putative zinc-finger [Prauserella halophila]